MAVNNDNLDRDPKLARLLEAVSREAPPAALDAAILAAARRAVDARPRLAGGGGGASLPPVRAKHNWYVPVSIAAVMVLSVSLVTLVHEEKGDELAQPPAAASAPPKVAAPATPAPSPAESEKPDAVLRDAVPARDPRGGAEEKRQADAKQESKPEAKAPAAPEATAELAKKQRTEKMESSADSAVAAGAARNDQDANATTARLREQAAPQDRAPAPARSETQASGRPAQERSLGTIGPRGFDGATLGGATSGAAAPQPPAALSRDAKPALEPFPAAQAPALGTSAGPAAPPAAPQAKAPAALRRSAPVEDAQIQSAPMRAEESVMAAPPPAASVMAKPAIAPSAKPVIQPRPPLWRGLEDQPPEKWLERLAEFKRDNRQADADALLTEFRRRFPDHPASAR